MFVQIVQVRRSKAWSSQNLTNSRGVSPTSVIKKNILRWSGETWRTVEDRTFLWWRIPDQRCTIKLLLKLTPTRICANRSLPTERGDPHGRSLIQPKYDKVKSGFHQLLGFNNTVLKRKRDTQCLCGFAGVFTFDNILHHLNVYPNPILIKVLGKNWTCHIICTVNKVRRMGSNSSLAAVNTGLKHVASAAI